MIEEILNYIEGPVRWTVTTLALIVFLLLVARRKSSRRKLFEPAIKPGDIIVNWDGRPGGQIPVEPWMESPEVTAVLAAITKNGKEARFIGGCVRDAMLRKPNTDIDLATQETQDQVVRLLEEAGIKAVPTGIEHGTVMAVINGQSFEITTLRKDIKTDGRHAVVEFTLDWKQDAARRDFTFNTLSATPDGMVYDYFNGIQDLANRVIRFVGRAPERIEEDHLRILRYFRFIATLGMRVESKREFQACINQAGLLRELSAERIRAELFKILSSNMLLDIMSLMYQQGVLQIILPYVISPDKLRQVHWLETRAMNFASVKPDPLRRLAALVDTDESGVLEIAAALRLSKAEQKRLTAMVAPTVDIRWDMSDEDVQAALYTHGATTVIDLILLNWAAMQVDAIDTLAEEKNRWLHLVEIADAQIGQEPTFPLKGQDVLDLGIDPGPEISRLLEQVEAWWLDGGCEANHAACLAELKSIIQ
ncbi:MAG: CCA tRNA nucleotidyltransferase [Rhodospirillaceae bacterium]|nr:CCA tRNA nucleotidyltransferase [Rhodospirillaceae bacterium]